MDKHIETLNVMESSYAHIRKNDSEFEEIEAAKEALQERAEREKGCSLCHGEHLKNAAISNHFGAERISLVSGGIDESEEQWFTFCPKCGKRLK